MKNWRSLLFLLATFFLTARQVQAYIDPGTGNMILQLIIGGIAGALVFLKMFWHRLVGLFVKRQPKSQDSNGSADHRHD